MVDFIGPWIGRTETLEESLRDALTLVAVVCACVSVGSCVLRVVVVVVG